MLTRKEMTLALAHCTVFNAVAVEIDLHFEQSKDQVMNNPSRSIYCMYTRSRAGSVD